jgi:branched-chain amino acid transport system substrate-binding protein
MQVLLLALVVFLGACREPAPIRIGLAGPLSDDVGGPMRLAAELAVEEINAAGGVRGRRIELVARDDHGDLDSAVAVAAQLRDAGVVAVVGHVYSGTTLAAAPVYGGASPVAVITPSSSSPEVALAGGHVFRLCPTDLDHAAALATWIRRGLGLSRGAVLYLNNSYGRGMRTAFESRFRGLGGTLLWSYPYLTERPDVGAYLDRLREDGSAQFLMIAGNREDAEAILRELAARGLALPVLGGDGLEGIEQAGPMAEGVHVTAAYVPGIATPENAAFMAAWRARWPEAGPPNQPAAATYDALYLLAGVMRAGATSRRQILRALPQLGDDLPAVRGATGVLAHDGGGDLSRAPVLISMVRGGAMRLVER